MSLTPTDQTKLLIGAVAIVPYLATLAVFLVPMYILRKQSMLGAAWKDSLFWLASIIVFYGSSVGFMYVPWPGLDSKVE